MSNTPDATTIAGVVAGVVAGVGAAWAALKRLGGGGITNHMQEVIEMHERRIATLEAQMNDIARERVEDRAASHAERREIFERLLDLDKKTSTVLAILDERRQ